VIIRVTKPSYRPDIVLQRAGYTPFRDPRTGESSFVRRLRTNFYPRWHLYVVEEGAQLLLNLHLDQKQASYEGSNKHSGEYSGSAVEAEAERICSYF
jgi:hypothetical protein